MQPNDSGNTTSWISEIKGTTPSETSVKLPQILEVLRRKFSTEFAAVEVAIVYGAGAARI
jgi:ammonia channel protein AmtB